MSTIAMLESLDTPMLDFTDDTDVQMAGSSNESWLTSHHMDEDSHLHTEHNTPLPVLEVDMAPYEETTTEYEMLDAQYQNEQVDAEVVDVSFHESPQPSLMTSVPSASEAHPIVLPAQPWADKNEGNALVATNPLATGNIVVETHSLKSEETTAAEPVSFSGNAISNPSLPPEIYHQPSSEFDGVTASEADSLQTSKLLDHSPNAEELIDATPIATVPLTEPRSDDPPQIVEAADAAPDAPDVSKHGPAIPHEHPSVATAALEQSASTDVPAPTDDVPPSDAQGSDNYVDPPPPIHLSLRIGIAEGDQPDFVLFNLPESSTSSADEPLVLLQHLPSLYYEPITSVFEAFRSEEYFSHLQELSEAEMAINAYDLQLLISEDNVYAREVSLHDLYAMHHGVGLPGNLRVSLQSVVPRFITRYNQLRDQITSLTFADEPLAEERTDDSDPHIASRINQAESNSDLPQRDMQTGSSSEQTLLAQSSNVDVSATTDATNRNTEPVSAATNNTSEASARDEVGDEKFVLRGETEALEVVAESKVEDNPRPTEATQEPDAAETDPSFEHNENVEALDADTIHNDAAEGGDAIGEDQETEYFDAVAPEADDEDGYGDEFVVDGADGTGTTNVEDPTVMASRDENSVGFNGLDDDEHDASEEVVHAQLLSASTSHGTNETGEDADADADAEYDEEAYEEEQTNHSRLEEHDDADQGNHYEDDDIGDEEFGEEDLDAETSEEGTLDGSSPTEDATELPSTTSLTGEKSSSLDPAVKPSSASLEKKTTENSGQGPEKSRDFPAAHKNLSKRSLDEAELEEEISPLDSPGSKRSRVL